MKNKKIAIGLGLLTTFSLSGILFYHQLGSKNLEDLALLSIIKNDQKIFEDYITRGGKLSAILDIEGNRYTVGELIVKHERLGFVQYALSKKMEFGINPSKNFDVYSLAVEKNNSEILNLLTVNKTGLLKKSYGKNEWSLLHMASAECADQVVSVLHKTGLSWDHKAKDGSTPLTVAAEAGCLQALSYWKENGANYRAKDGRGITALDILLKKKDSAISAFAQSFIEKRTPASVVAMSMGEPNFYKKRKIPKDNLADRAHLIEPEDRPDDANETAENSEFSD